MYYRHGHTARTNKGKCTPTYNCWKNMLCRCNDKNHASYKNYGGRGIFVCKRWGSFSSFLEDMGSKPIGYSLDRINNDEGYSKNNCRWATIKEQANNCRKNRYIEINGLRLSVSQWAERTGARTSTLFSRLRTGKSEYDSIMKPVAKKGDWSKGRELVERKLCKICGNKFYCSPSTTRRGRLVGGVVCSIGCKKLFLNKLPDLEKP